MAETEPTQEPQNPEFLPADSPHRISLIALANALNNPDRPLPPQPPPPPAAKYRIIVQAWVGHQQVRCPIQIALHKKGTSGWEIIPAISPTQEGGNCVFNIAEDGIYSVTGVIAGYEPFYHSPGSAPSDGLALRLDCYDPDTGRWNITGNESGEVELNDQNAEAKVVLIFSPQSALEKDITVNLTCPESGNPDAPVRGKSSSVMLFQYDNVNRPQYVNTINHPTDITEGIPTGTVVFHVTPNNNYLVMAEAEGFTPVFPAKNFTHLSSYQTEGKEIWKDYGLPSDSGSGREIVQVKDGNCEIAIPFTRNKAAPPAAPNEEREEEIVEGERMLISQLPRISSIIVEDSEELQKFKKLITEIEAKCKELEGTHKVFMVSSSLDEWKKAILDKQKEIGKGWGQKNKLLKKYETFCNKLIFKEIKDIGGITTAIQDGNIKHGGIEEVAQSQKEKLLGAILKRNNAIEEIDNAIEGLIPVEIMVANQVDRVRNATTPEEVEFALKNILTALEKLQNELDDISNKIAQVTRYTELLKPIVEKTLWLKGTKRKIF